MNFSFFLFGRSNFQYFLSGISLWNRIMWYQRSLRDVVELYGTEVSLQGVEEYRKASGIESISSTCLKAAKFSAILINDGIEMDKRHDIQWHKNFTPCWQNLKNWTCAEQIPVQVRYLWTFTFNLLITNLRLLVSTS